MNSDIGNFSYGFHCTRKEHLMHKKLRVFIPVIVILLLVLSGIFLYFSRKIEKTSPEALAKSFLTEFFTWNKDNRLDIFSADSTDTYYTPFRQYLTEDALQNLAVNRLPYKYDITVPDGTAAEVTDLSCTFDEKGTNCQFTVSIQIKSSQKTLNQAASGQLSFTRAGSDVLIDNVHITGISSLD